MLLFYIALHVQIERARVVAVDTVSALRNRCGIDRPIRACTQFSAYSLDASCNSSDDGWSIRASAWIAPQMIVLAPEAMTHEYLHISDVRQSANDYLRVVSAQRYGTANQCEDAAAREIAAFGERIKISVQESNARRHPTKYHH
ncbi:MAG TPA: hypothetical protein VGK31_01415 [Thermoanaerobaculia bacterium]